MLPWPAHEVEAASHVPRPLRQSSLLSDRRPQCCAVCSCNVDPSHRVRCWQGQSCARPLHAYIEAGINMETHTRAETKHARTCFGALQLICTVLPYTYLTLRTGCHSLRTLGSERAPQILACMYHLLGRSKARTHLYNGLRSRAVQAFHGLALKQSQRTSKLLQAAVPALSSDTETKLLAERTPSHMEFLLWAIFLQQGYVLASRLLLLPVVRLRPADELPSRKEDCTKHQDASACCHGHPASIARVSCHIRSS